MFNRERQKALSWVAVGALCITLTVVYITLRVEIHTFDAISYAWNIRDKAFGLLFHPHHLLYAPLGRVAYSAATALGYSGYADVPVQVVNAVAGALGVGLFWGFGTLWTGRRWASLGAAGLIGVSYAYWLYAAEVEVYTIATAFIILCMVMLVQLSHEPHLRWAALLGVAHMGAIMFHQTNALLTLPVLAFLLIYRPTRSLRVIGVYAGVGGGLTLAAYGLVGLTSNFASLTDFFNWFMGYTQSGIWGGYLSAEHLPALRSGWQLAVSQNGWLALAFYAVGVAGLVMLAERARRSHEAAAWFAFGLIWLVTYTVFFWWWEPWNIEFWIGTLPLWGMFILAVFPTQQPAEPSTAWAAYTLGLFVLAGLIAQSNVGVIRGVSDRDEDYYFRMVQALDPTLTADDLVVTRGNVLDIYLPFYLEHNGVLSMREVTYAHQPDRAALMGDVIGRLDWAYNTGQVVFMDSFLLDTPLDGNANAFGFTAGEIDTLRERYPWRAQVDMDGEAVFYHWPRYDDPTATMWAFDGTLAGWKAYGINVPRFEEGAWCFSGGADPQLSSHPIQLDGSRFNQLEITITVTEPTEMEVFWRTPTLDYSLERMVTASLEAGENDVTLDMSDQPGWGGTLTQLRVDPVPGQTGVTACMSSIAVVP